MGFTGSLAIPRRRLGGRQEYGLWNCVQTDITCNNRKINKLEREVKNRADW
jgi:hypothetical protein